jgi:hypothetical protein
MGRYADGFIRSACDKLSGSFADGDPKQEGVMYDYNHDGEKCFWEFFFISKSGGAGELDREECNMQLKNEVNGCSYGGASMFGGWFYRYVCLLPCLSVG